MRKAWGYIFMLLLATSPAWAQIFLQNEPLATLPLNGTETVLADQVINQVHNTVRIPVGNLGGSQGGGGGGSPTGSAGGDLSGTYPNPALSCNLSGASGCRITLGLGTAATKAATASGANVASTSGAFTTGHVLVAADANGTVSDGGAPSAGSGTVNTGTINQIAAYPATGAAVSGLSGFTFGNNGNTINLGGSGQQGIITQSGGTSGTITFQTQTAAGSYNWNWPTAAGTSGQPLLSGGGGSNPTSFGTLGLAGGGTGAITAAGARTNLGLGTAAVANIGQSGANVPQFNLANVWSAGQSSAPVTLTFGTTVTPDFSTGNVFILTLTGNVTTFANPANLPAGQCVVIFLVQDATGSRTITNWGSQYKFPGGTKPTLSTAASSVDSVTACSQTTSFIAVSFLGNFQ